MTLPKEATESEVRRLRDNIYGHHTDEGWNACKHNWMLPENVQWLRDRQQFHPAPQSTFGSYGN
jgi:hypothetical protein